MIRCRKPLNAGYAIAHLALLGLILFDGGGGRATLAAGSASASFDGVRGEISVPDSSSLRITTGLTAEAWIKPSTVSTRSQFVGKGQWELSLEPVTGGFRILFEFSTNFGAWHSVASGAYPFGQWYHVAGTYDGTTARLFVNGSLVASGAFSGSIDPSTNPLRMGTVEEFNDYYKGLIDEVRVSNTVRYTTAFAVPQSPFTADASTRGLWHLDEGTGTTTADASGNNNSGTLSTGTTWSTDTAFSGVVDTTPPIISSVTSGNITAGGATITWTTNEPASSQVEYGTSISYGSLSSVDSTLLSTHTVTLSGLTSNTTYNYRVISRDAAGNQGVSGNFTFTTLQGTSTAPVISNVAAGNIGLTTATVSWTTDVLSDSQVEYGLNTNYGTLTTLDSTLVTNHSQAIGGLSSSQTYHFRVRSRGQNGILATSADSTFMTPAPSASTQGQWAAIMNWPLVAVHASLLTNGDVVVWDAWETPGTPSGRRWNPSTQAFTSVPVPASALFCAAHTTLKDGRPVVIGGHHGGDTGIPDTNTFDPATNTWVTLAPMHYSRWYPSAVAMNDGRLLALGGEISPGVFADVPEVYDPATNVWTVQPNATLNLGEYTSDYVMPNGNVFVVAGPDLKSRILDTTRWTWTTLSTAPVASGTTAMYRPGRVIASGGGTGNSDPVQAGTALIDLSQPTPTWRQTAPMARPRDLHNLVVMPDGKVLAVGGSSFVSLESTTGELSAEMWDPATETWTTMASMAELRMYHSFALLLLDGRVLVAGGGRIGTAVDHLTAQIYSPPYLFKGARPTVTSAPGSAAYNSTMTVQTPDAANIASVSLIRLPSATHSFEMSSRFVDVTFTRQSGSLVLQTPVNANVAPPGYYMLFLVNSNGVPSVATVVSLGAGSGPDTQAPTVSMTGPSNGDTVAGAINVSATAADNVGVTSVQFLLDGNPLGSSMTATPYTMLWDTTTTTNASHALSARALDATGNAATATPVTVTVANSSVAPTATATVAPGSIYTGASASLSWSTTNATSVTIDQNIGPVAASGSRTVSPTSTTTYTVTATNSVSSATATATLTVTAPPSPTASLTVAPTSIASGGSSTLSWSTTDAATVTIDNGIGSVPASGSRTVSPTATTTYTITASNATGTATSSATLTVTVPLPTASLSASPTTITAGSSATLLWSTTNATSATIDQGIGTVALSGTRSVTPTATTTYTLTATNTTGSATATATVTVNPAPPPGSGSLQFNGSNSRARFTALPTLTVFTVEAWVKRTSDMGRYETFVSNANNGYSKETVGLYVDGAGADCGTSPPDQFAWAYTKANTSGWFTQCSGMTADLNVWHHIAVTRDASNTARIFIDGVLRRTTTNTTAPASSNGAFGLGDAGDATTEYFAGLLDEVRISSVVRYTGNFTPQAANFAADTSTVALYHFDEGSGQTLVDSSGNNRNGVLGTSSSVEAVDPKRSTDVPVR